MSTRITPALVTLTLSSQAAGVYAANPGQLQLPLRTMLDLTDYEVCLASLDFTNSVPNVAPVYNNSQLQYVWTDGQTYSLPLLTGGYLLSDLNSALQQQMKSNGHFLVYTDPTTGIQTQQFYLGFLLNPNYLVVTLTATQLPSTLPSGYSNPNNCTLGKCPQLLVSPGMSPLFGFAAGTYPSSQAITQIINGTSPALSSQVSLINVCCNLVSDGHYATNPSSIHTFCPPANSFGSQLSIQPFERCWYPVNLHQVTAVTVTLCDQTNTPLALLPGLPITATLYARRAY